ncbi:MAG: TIGR03905 family TSCPD domain-containing protein [Coriobacteriia bacterium]|nr:TIGR03905 family TSCPD domain-containing protein [Coriobacteriia bacterium]
MVRKEFFGVCASHVNFSLDADGCVLGVSFEKGCSGNLKAISKLVEGRPAEEIIALMSGIPCGGRSASCPDQFALALQKELNRRELG